MFTLTMAIVLPLVILALAVWLSWRARKGRISAATPLGANDGFFNKDQRRAAEVIVNRNAGKKMEEQTSGDRKRPGKED